MQKQVKKYLEVLLRNDTLKSGGKICSLDSLPPLLNVWCCSLELDIRNKLFQSFEVSAL